MTSRDEDSDDLLAAEYVLGVLRGPRCERFEARLRADAALAQRVRDWEARLAPLAEGYEPLDGSEAAWQGIERRLFPAGTSAAAAAPSGKLVFWRRAAAAMTLVAFLFVVTAAYLLSGAERPQCYAVLADEQSRPVAVVFDRRHMAELVVLPVGSRLSSGPGEVELWIVAGESSVRVGLLNPDGETRLALEKSMSSAVMAANARLLVTREAPGGPPAGQPTRQPIAQGVVALLGATPAPAKPI